MKIHSNWKLNCDLNYRSSCAIYFFLGEHLWGDRACLFKETANEKTDCSFNFSFKIWSSFKSNCPWAPSDGCCRISLFHFFVLFSPSVPEQLFHLTVTERCKQHICQQTNVETGDKVFSPFPELWHLGWHTVSASSATERALRTTAARFPIGKLKLLVISQTLLLISSKLRKV